MKEQERWLTSIEAKTQQLSSTWQNFSQTVINSEGAKILLDTLNKALKVLTLMVDKVGTLKTLAGGFFATKLIRGGKPCWLINKSIKCATREFSSDVYEISFLIKNSRCKSARK